LVLLQGEEVIEAEAGSEVIEAEGVGLGVVIVVGLGADVVEGLEDEVGMVVAEEEEATAGMVIVPVVAEAEEVGSVEATAALAEAVTAATGVGEEIGDTVLVEATR
jgi:hypothetical protein